MGFFSFFKNSQSKEYVPQDLKVKDTYETVSWEKYSSQVERITQTIKSYEKLDNCKELVICPGSIDVSMPRDGEVELCITYTTAVLDYFADLLTGDGFMGLPLELRNKMLCDKGFPPEFINEDTKITLKNEYTVCITSIVYISLRPDESNPFCNYLSNRLSNSFPQYEVSLWSCNNTIQLRNKNA